MGEVSSCLMAAQKRHVDRVCLGEQSLTLPITPLTRLISRLQRRCCAIRLEDKREQCFQPFMHPRYMAATATTARRQRLQQHRGWNSLTQAIRSRYSAQHYSEYNDGKQFMLSKKASESRGARPLGPVRHKKKNRPQEEGTEKRRIDYGEGRRGTERRDDVWLRRHQRRKYPHRRRGDSLTTRRQKPHHQRYQHEIHTGGQLSNVKAIKVTPRRPGTG